MRAEFDLVGRDDELAELNRFLNGGDHGAMAVVGDAGVGKTALVGYLGTQAVTAGWRLVHAVGVEAEKSFSLGGLNQMVFGLRSLVPRLDVRDRDVLATVFGADPATPPTPMALTVALLNLLSEVAQQQPVLLLVEDVHWLDDLSATVLNAAGRRVIDPRVRVVATYRPHAGTPFALAGWSELTLEPLGPVDSARIVDGLQLPLSPATKRAILEVAAGNPLALRELPRNAEQIDDADPTLPLTDRLVTVFGGRLNQVAARVRTELLRAALDGTKAYGANDIGSRYVMTDVQEAVDADLLTVDPRGDVVFRHPLVRAAVVHQAGAHDRRDAHAHLAGLYEDAVVRRATHLSAAATGPDQQVADLLDQAARQSIRRGGSAVAVDWLRRAAELSTAPTRRLRLLADAAFVASQSSRFHDAQTFVDTAQAVGDEPPAAVLTGAYLALYRDGEVPAGHRRVLAALRQPEVLDDETLSRMVNLLLAMTQYSADAGLWRQTVDAIGRLGDRVQPASLIYRDAWGDVARTGHTVRDRLAEHLGRLSALEPWDVMRLAVAAYYVDGLEDVRVALRRLMERDRDRGAVTNAMTMQHLVLLDLIRSGQWADAQELGRDGLELTRIHRNELFRYQFTAYLAVLAAGIGEVDVARRNAAEVTAWAGPRRLGLLLGYAQRAAVLVALAEGDYDAAYDAAVRIGAPGEFPPYAYQAVDGLLDMVEAAVHSGHQIEARAHADAAVRLGLADISPRLAALATAVRAMTAPDDAAGALYESALAHPALASVPFEQARIRLAHGSWLRRRRRTMESRATLALAAEAFESLGARGWATRARDELRAAGATVRRAAGQAATLSAQERKIAELAAGGHSNKQIAAQLYLSPRTVGAHLYRIFPKLGITSRAGLALALRAIDADAEPDARSP